MITREDSPKKLEKLSRRIICWIGRRIGENSPECSQWYDYQSWPINSSCRAGRIVRKVLSVWMRVARG
jgi:hypothetical protein